jgi:hypothetical protein
VAGCDRALRPAGAKRPCGYGWRTMTEKPKAVPAHSTTGVRVVRLPGGGEVDDRVAVEEPLELRIGGRPVAVTM